MIDLLYIVCLGIIVYRSLTIRTQDTVSKRSFNNVAFWLGVFGLFAIILVFVNFYQAVINNQSELIVIDGIFTQQTFIYLLMVIVGAHIIVVITAFSCKTYF